MPLTVKERSGADIEPIPAGVYVATCYGVIDLGTHYSEAFKNEVHKALIQWELPDVRGEFERDGKRVNLPRAISRRYTLSLSEKANLRRDLESWRGRKFTAQELAGFDLRTVLGTGCQLQIVHETNREGRIHATVAAIMALPKGVPRPKPENSPVFFSFEEGGDRPALPPGLPEWVNKIITESREWRERSQFAPAPAAQATPPQPPAPETGAGPEDDVPF